MAIRPAVDGKHSSRSYERFLSAHAQHFSIVNILWTAGQIATALYKPTLKAKLATVSESLTLKDLFKWQ